MRQTRRDKARQTRARIVFHTKVELLTEVFDTAVLGELNGTPPDRTDWLQAAVANRDPARALRGFVKGQGDILARVAPLFPVINAAAQVDPEVADTQAHRERLRVAGHRAPTTALNDRKALRPNVDVDTATDILLTLLGPAVYGSLVADRGWPHERYLDWATAPLWPSNSSHVEPGLDDVAVGHVPLERVLPLLGLASGQGTPRGRSGR